MDERPRVVVLYSPAGGGHRSVANAVATALRRERRDADVEVLDVLSFAPSWFRYDLAWKVFQEHGGHVWDWMFRKTDRTLPAQPDRLRKQLNRILLRKLTKFLIEKPPHRVVCTHYLPAIAISKLIEDKKLETHLSIVVTDYVAHEAWIYPGVDDYFVPNAAVARSIMRRDVHWKRVHITGIPIAAEMDEPPIALPHRLPLEVLMLCGGVPAELVFETLSALKPSTSLRFTILTGASEDIKARAEQIVRDRGLDATVHGQLPGLRDVLDRSHVVVTKTGGLITTECLARGRAMVLPWPAFGQEHGNLLKIVEAGAGAAANDHRDVGEVLEALAADPDRLKSLGDKARGAAIRGSSRRVARFLLRGLLGSPDAAVSGIMYASS